MSIFTTETTRHTGQIRQYTSLFRSLFTGITIVRRNGQKEEFIKVPIRYGNGNSYEKMGEINEDKRIAQILPVLSFTLSSIEEDIERKTSPYNRLKGKVDENNMANSSFNRLPYNFEYEVTLRTKSADELLQLLEQITAVFNPQLIVQITDSQDYNIENQNIIITLNQTPLQIMDNFEESLDTNRYLELVLTFTLKGYLYKPPTLSPVVLDASLLVGFEPQECSDDIILYELNNLGTVVDQYNECCPNISVVSNTSTNNTTVVASTSDLNVHASSTNFTVGDPVYFDGTSWQKAIANHPDTLGVGIVSQIPNNSEFMIRFIGPIKKIGWGLVAGNYYFVSDTVAGGLVTSPQTYSNPILYAISSEDGIVLPLRPSIISMTQ